MKKAGSLKGFKHSVATLERMRKTKLENKRIKTSKEKLKHINSLLNGVSTIVVNNLTNESKSFVSGREAAKFIGINQSALAKYISKQNFYLGRGFLVYKSSTDLKVLLESEAYLKAIARVENPHLKHSEASKESIRKANLGKKLSEEVKKKLALNSRLSKSVIAINNVTSEK